MLRLFYTLYLKIAGWKAVNGIPKELKKFVLVVAPHTSAWDVLMGLAFRSVLRLDHIKFIGKQELFKPPFGFMFRRLGGIPVDRQNNNNFVDQVTSMFEGKDQFAIALSPEGTRQKVERIRSGFYHIARKANVPIVMLALDFEHKEFRFAVPFYTSENEAEDLSQVILFFGNVKGKHPELGLSHLVPGAT